MTATRLLSAGLIAAAILATPVMARETSAANPHIAEAVNACIARHVEAHAGISAPHVGAFTAAPVNDGEGESCDVGDNPHVC